MKLSALIEGLNNALSQYGDLEVGQLDGEWLYYQPVQVVCLIQRSDEIKYEDDLGDRFVGISFDSMPIKDSYPRRKAEPVLICGKPLP